MPLIISHVNPTSLEFPDMLSSSSQLSIALCKKTGWLLHQENKMPFLFVNIFLFDFLTGGSEMPAGRCRVHSVWSDPFRLGALAYFLGCVFLPCSKSYQRSSEWNLLVHLFMGCCGRSEGLSMQGSFCFFTYSAEGMLKKIIKPKSMALLC